MKRLLAFLALCLPIYILAQGFGSFSHDQPYFAKDRVAGGGGGEPGTNIVYSFTNLYRWWVASDVPTNVVVSNQWSDRIISAKMDQMDLSLAPTNSPNGIYFNGAQYMTNIETFVDNGIPTMFLFILQCENPPAPKWIWGGAEGPFTGFWLNGRMDYGDGIGGTFAGVQPFPENVIVDFLFHSSQARFYTNGVLGKHVANIVNNGMRLNRLGWGYINPTYYYKGYIKEILVWTNTVAGPLDSTSISNLHYYATNRYQYSP